MRIPLSNKKCPLLWLALPPKMITLKLCLPLSSFKSFHDCQKFQDYIVLRLLENTFVKLPHPWHDLIINPPCRTAPSANKKNCPPSAMKSIYKKVPPCCFGETLCPCSTGKSCGGIYSLNICK